MKLSQRVLLGAAGVSLCFTVLILVLILQYSASVEVATDYAQQTEPAREAIEHLLTTIYSDFLLVEEYMLVTDYDTLLEYDLQLSHSETECEILTEEVDDLIVLGTIDDEGVITSYNTAILVYSSWQRSRDQLLALHKQSVVNQAIPIVQMRAERERFITLMQNSTAHFADSLERLAAQNIEFQRELDEKTGTMRFLLILLLVSFVGVSIFGSLFLTQRLTKPLDEMSEASVDFTKGNYKTRVSESSSVAEISSLQKQLNRVYGLVDTTFKTKDQKNQAAEKLLPSQYKDILDFVKSSSMQGRVLTIKDVKKHFNLTHPTVISRLKYLQENGYIVMKKEGRDKCIYEA